MIILARRKGPGDQLPSASGIKALWGFILSRSGIGRNDSLTAHEADGRENDEWRMASSDWTLATRSVVLFQHEDSGQSIHAHNGTAHSAQRGCGGGCGGEWCHLIASRCDSNTVSSLARQTPEIPIRSERALG